MIYNGRANVEMDSTFAWGVLVGLSVAIGDLHFHAHSHFVFFKCVCVCVGWWGHGRWEHEWEFRIISQQRNARGCPVC